MKRAEPRFVVCVKNKGYAAALELRKLIRWSLTNLVLRFATFA